MWVLGWLICSYWKHLRVSLGLQWLESQIMKFGTILNKWLLSCSVNPCIDVFELKLLSSVIKLCYR